MDLTFLDFDKNVDLKKVKIKSGKKNPKIVKLVMIRFAFETEPLFLLWTILIRLSIRSSKNSCSRADQEHTRSQS